MKSVLSFLLLVGVLLVQSSCVEPNPTTDPGPVADPGPVVVTDDRPSPSGPVVHDHRQPPPPPRYEGPEPAPRADYVWIKGHYERREGSYVWVRAHWETAKASGGPEVKVTRH